MHVTSPCTDAAAWEPLSFRIYFSLFFVDVAWPVDRRWQGPRTVRPAMEAYSRRTPRWGPSRACEVSSFEKPHRHVLRIALLTRLLWRCILRIALIAGGTKFMCEHTLGANRLKSRLSPTSNDIAPYRCCDLIKRQHIINLSRNINVTIYYKFSQT